MTPRVDWDVRVPAELRPALEAALTPLLWLVPAWCYSLEVRWDDGEEEHDGRYVVASMETNAMYRCAILTVFPGWLVQPEAERRTILTHELLHIVLQPMADAKCAIMGTMKGQPKALRAELAARWGMALEGAVCDLTAMLGER